MVLDRGRRRVRLWTGKLYRLSSRLVLALALDLDPGEHDGSGGSRQVSEVSGGMAAGQGEREGLDGMGWDEIVCVCVCVCVGVGVGVGVGVDGRSLLRKGPGEEG